MVESVEFEEPDDEFLKSARFDYPCIVIGFAFDRRGRLGVMSFWHSIIEDNAKSWERSEIDETLTRLGKQLARVVERAIGSMSAHPDD